MKRRRKYVTKVAHCVNPVAKGLSDRRYQQRVVPNKKAKVYDRKKIRKDH